MKKLIFFALLLTSILAEDAGDVFNYNQSGNYNAASRVSKISEFIALQLVQNSNVEDISKVKLAVTSFVNIEDLKDTNKFGNIIAENLLHDLYVRGFNIVDFKVMPHIEMDRSGDFIFSRKPSEIANKEIKVDYLVSGIWAYYSDGIAITVRIIKDGDYTVVSSAKAFVPKADIIDILNSTKTSYTKLNKSEQVEQKVESKTEEKWLKKEEELNQEPDKTQTAESKTEEKGEKIIDKKLEEQFEVHTM